MMTRVSQSAYMLLHNQTMTMAQAQVDAKKTPTINPLLRNYREIRVALSQLDDRALWELSRMPGIKWSYDGLLQLRQRGREVSDKDTATILAAIKKAGYLEGE